MLESCLSYIRSWMFQNRLMLNDSKTEFLILGTPRQLSKVNIDGLTVGNAVVEPSNTVRNLGVWFDSNLDMETHVVNICKSSFYVLYNLRRIRKYLDKESAETIVHALITTKLDYCNGLLFGHPDSVISRLQKVQNACARLVCNSSKFCHVTPLFDTLHWLPIRQRIEFKILLIVFKSLLGQAPSYISDMLKFKQNSRNLRSSNDTLLLQINSCITKITLGDRSFYCAAPKLWNQLPFNIRNAKSVENFKKMLKTHLFNRR